MSQYDQRLLIAFAVLGLYASGLLFFMIFRANRILPQSRRIPFSASWRRWERLAVEYKGFYPRSILPRLTESCAYSMLILAVATFVVRFWEYAKGR